VTAAVVVFVSFVAVVIVGLLWMVRWSPAARRRDEEFIRVAAEFARCHGGWPCGACVTSHRAGFCEHRTPYEEGPKWRRP
jgi:hypothetical protein